MEAVASDQQEQQPPNIFFEYARHESWTRQQLMDYQEQALRACRDYAYAHSPFYQRFHKGLMDRPLQELPVLTKAMVLEHFDDVVTDRAIRLRDVRQHLAEAEAPKLYLDRYTATATSGSTGQPGIFLSDRTEAALEGSTFMRALMWGGVTLQNKSAVVSSLRMVQPTVLREGQQVPLVLPATLPLETLVQRLNAWQPEVLVGHSSINAALANEQYQGRLHISPRVVFCGSDTLTGSMRQRIEEVWQTKIFNSYGTTEGNALAAECASHQGLHLFEDYSLVEVVDENNQPLPPGTAGGRVLLTVLFRRTQPLIRYELSDLVTTSASEICSCGRPFALIEAIEGRMIEVLYLPSSAGKSQRISPYLFTRVFNKLPIGAWQVVYEQDGLHIFLTGAAEELRDEAVREALQQALAEQGVLVPAIDIHRVTVLSQTANGKSPIVISRVPAPVL